MEEDFRGKVSRNDGLHRQEGGVEQRMFQTLLRERSLPYHRDMIKDPSPEVAEDLRSIETENMVG